MKKSFRQALLLTVFAAAACSHNPPPPPPAAEAPAAPQAALSQTDQGFVQAVGASDQFEIQTSQLAAEKAHRKQVKDMASHLVQAHTGTTEQLTKIVQSKNVPPMTPQLTADQQQMLDQLKGLNGMKFDQAYVQDLIKDHEMAVTVFKQEISDGQDADIKSFAQQTLPVIEQHLVEARKLGGMHDKGMHDRGMRHHHRSHTMDNNASDAPETTTVH